MRGENVANSITVSRNRMPNLRLGGKAYRLARPSACPTERRVIVDHPSVRTVARVATSKRGRARDDQFDRSCSMMVAALKKP